VQVNYEPGAAMRGTESWLVGAAGLLRLAQMLPWLAVVAAGRWHDYRSPALVAVIYIAYAWWAVLLFRNGRRQRGFSARWATADLAINACCLVIVGSLCVPGYATSFQNWTLGPAMGAAILSIIWCGWGAGIAAGSILSVAYALGARGDMTAVKAGTGTVIGNVVSLMAFTIAAGLVAGRLRSTARQTDLATAETLRAQQAEATAEARRARLEERVRQYGLLHDNVLTTLTLLGAGAGGINPEMRERCQMDATFLRALVSAVNDASPDGLNAALGQVAYDQSLLGLQIHHSHDGVAQDLPTAVIAAITQAAKEALNNVAKHARTGEAWVVAEGQPNGVVVSVADHGCGFDTTSTMPGLGISRSLRERMASVGGEVEIDSLPGQGTYVEIRWAR
jgi:signal transduction histidine kinase